MSTYSTLTFYIFYAVFILTIHVLFYDDTFYVNTFGVTYNSTCIITGNNMNNPNMC